MPLFRRIPKRGFNNKNFKKSYTITNVGQLNIFDDGAVVDLAVVLQAGIVSKEKHSNLFKILGVFELQVAEFFAEQPEVSQAMERPLSHGDMQVLHLLRQLSPEARQEVHAFIEFKLRRERTERRAEQAKRAREKAGS